MTQIIMARSQVRMYQPWVDDDTIDEMDVWATYFQMGEGQMETMLFIDLVLAGCASAPAVMSAMSWLVFIPRKISNLPLAAQDDPMRKHAWKGFSQSPDCMQIDEQESLCV